AGAEDPPRGPGGVAETEEPLVEERPKVEFDLGWTEPELAPPLDLVEDEPIAEPTLDEEPEARAPRRFRWRGRKREEQEEPKAEEPEFVEPEPQAVEAEGIVVEPEVVEPEAIVDEPEVVEPDGIEP